MKYGDIIWKDIEGYNGDYQISNFGRVKSVDRLSWNGKGQHNTGINKCCAGKLKTSYGYEWKYE